MSIRNRYRNGLHIYAFFRFERRLKPLKQGSDISIAKMVHGSFGVTEVVSEGGG